MDSEDEEYARGEEEALAGLDEYAAGAPGAAAPDDFYDDQPSPLPLPASGAEYADERGGVAYDFPGGGGGAMASSFGSREGGAMGAISCQPTASVYLGGWYDWLVCFSNFHTEHHDFPDVPAFRLRELRDAAPAFYAEGSLAGARDGWWSTMRRTFAGRSFYACSGDMEAVESSDGDAELTERSGGGASAEPQFS